jgi:hypothetical protein
MKLVDVAQSVSLKDKSDRTKAQAKQVRSEPACVSAMRGMELTCSESTGYEIEPRNRYSRGRAKRLRELISEVTEIDPDFILGPVLDLSSTVPKQHRFLEAEPMND